MDGPTAMENVVRDNDDEMYLEHHGEVVVDDVLDHEDQPHDANEPLRFHFSWRKLWRFAGPAWLMSLAYLDPGNLEADLQQGAYSSYRLVWLLWWATVAGLFLQEMSARLGIVTGRDLAQTVREGYPRWLNYVIYVNMEIAVIGSDIQEVVGTGVAIYLLSDKYIPIWVGCLITAADTLTFLAIQYLGVRYLEAFICILISTMSICFFVNWGLSGGSPMSGTGGLPYGWAVPTVQSWAVTQAVGTVGSVIMPHNLYLHSGLVLSRKVARNKPNRVYAAIWYTRIESAGALLLSFFINLAVVAVNADRFYDPTCAALPDGPLGCMTVEAFNKSEQSAPEIGGLTQCNVPLEDGVVGVCADLSLQSEGYALESVLGHGRFTLMTWAVGLCAAGQAATMVCTYAGQIIMGGCLQIKLNPWVRVLITRVFALGPALLVATTTSYNQRLFNSINEYLNVLQSVQLPFAMLPVLHFSAQQHLLGRFKSSLWLTIVCSLTALTVIGFSLVLVLQFVRDPKYSFSTGSVVAVCLYGAVYFGLCIRMVWDELVSCARWFVLRIRGENEETRSAGLMQALYAHESAS